MHAFALDSSSDENDDDDEEEEDEQQEEQPAPAPAPVGPPALENAEELRFRAELEFVQLLASPMYLHYLATYEYLEDDEFLRYLKYLRYWRRPEYVVFIEYPECLRFLDKLNDDENFRKELKSPHGRDKEHHDQFYRWRNRYFDMHKFPSFLPDRDDDFGAATYGLNDENINDIHAEFPVDVSFDIRQPTKKEMADVANDYGPPPGHELPDKWWLK